MSSNPSESLSERERRAQRSLELAMAAVRTASENGGRDITLLDMRQQAALFDYFVSTSGMSRRQ